jgi:flavorubredoxin
MTEITEIAPDIFRISTFIPEANLQFAQFLVRDEEPLLFHTGMKALFPIVHEAVTKLLPPEKIKWIGFSHFEADECGSLPEWQTVAPEATPVCSFVGKVVSVDDFALRPANGLMNGDGFSTGKYSFRFLQTPHVPHCWEAGLLFEETNKTLFCSDLFHQNGDVEPITTSDVIDRCRRTLVEYQQTPLANYIPYTNQTEKILKSLAALQPQTLATMHGSTFSGDGEKAILDLANVFKECFETEN